MRGTSTRNRLAGMAVVVVLGAVACTETGDTTVEPVTADPQTFVVIGAGQSDTGGVDDELRGLWARLFFQELSPRAVLVNLARPGATAASALVDQVPDALTLDPDVVTIWLGSADATAGTSPGAFADDLTAAVAAFGDATEVLVLTGWRDDAADALAPYVAAIRDVADRSSAALVEITDIDADDSTANQQVSERVLEVHRTR